DRLHEKSFIRDLGIAVPPFSAVDHADDLAKAISAIGLPSILKTRRFGYDGKGQIKLAGATRDAFAALGGVPCILEAFIPFEREISV
ncbi:ATP-grasp domain-containing protein, partial [Escherichia coli]|uniref:ATP-grasp domain-containing protein n=1 Tax=Escherichia coli TaxID=562 RepID=UPI003C765A64